MLHSFLKVDNPFAMMFVNFFFVFFRLDSAWSIHVFSSWGTCRRAIWDRERVTSPRKWRLRPLTRGSRKAEKEISVDEGIVELLWWLWFSVTLLNEFECLDQQKRSNMWEPYVSPVSELMLLFRGLSPKNYSQCHQKNSVVILSFIHLGRWTWIWWCRSEMAEYYCIWNLILPKHLIRYTPEN